MSHHIEMISQLTGRLEGINSILEDAGLQPKPSSGAHDEIFIAEIEALGRALGPLAEEITVDGDAYIIKMNRPQATFMINHTTSTLALIGEGLKTRLHHHRSNIKANKAIDDLISHYSDDDYPVTIREMLSKGKTDEITLILADVLMKAAADDLRKVCLNAAQFSVDRALLDFQTTPLMSMFHDVVEVGIGTHQKRSPAFLSKSNRLEKEMIGENVIKIDFRGSRQPVVEHNASTAQESLAQ